MSSIATVNKDQAVFNWAAQNPFLTDALLFQWLGENPANCAFVPIQGEAAQKTYIDGSGQRVYDFALQVTLMVSQSTDDTNVDNMYLQRTWADWIAQQERDGAYPDFGPKCSGYHIELLSNGPMLAQYSDNGTGKYQFFARINYLEVM